MIGTAISFLAHFFAPLSDLRPVFRLNGVEIDLNRRLVVVSEPFNLHCTENLKLSSNKHVLLESGQGTEHRRPNYLYSVWINSPTDQYGDPVIAEEPKYHIPYSKRPRTIRLKGRNNKCGCH